MRDKLGHVSSFSNMESTELLSASAILHINDKFICNDIELRECVSAVLHNYNIFSSHFYINLLNNFLYIEF